jgi:DNA-binding transcriptional regulator YiaG
MKKWSSEDIKNFRKIYGLTQTEVADLLGVTQNYIHMMEKGMRKPSKPLQILLSRIEEDYKKKGGG